jgi:hypothetical protein
LERRKLDALGRLDDGAVHVGLLGSADLGVVWLVRQSTSRSSAPPAVYPPDAKEILDRRFAAGEIDAEEYNSRREVLGNARQGTS